MRSYAMKVPTSACMPRLMRGGCRASTARPAASVSLLERIRDVVLRLIMLSAVSKESVKRSSSSGSGKASSSPRAWRPRERVPVAPPVTCHRDDPIRNEAVEDCIEFLKRSSAEGDAAKMSTVTAAETVSVLCNPATKPSSMDATDTMIAHGEPAN
ncbi:hypothetical protein ABZP36_010505 [Zizania latifolia]